MIYLKMWKNYINYLKDVPNRLDVPDRFADGLFSYGSHGEGKNINLAKFRSDIKLCFHFLGWDVWRWGISAESPFT